MIRNFNTEAEIFIQSTVEADTFGGFTIGLKSVGTVNAYVTQIAENLSVENGRIVKQVVTKLYSTESIPHDVTQVKCNGKSYDVLTFTDYNKIRVLSLVEVSNG